MSIIIRPATSINDHAWLADLWEREWGGTTMLTRGRVHHLHDLHALIAFRDDEPVGAATFAVEGDAAELLSLNAVLKGQGVGSALLAAAEGAARATGARRLWLITTNDNLDALGFYQRRGYRLTGLYPGAVDEARQLKPSIPTIGYNRIPLHDELELSKVL
jgi:GNAT superfamily N-acetyltransferase